MLLVSLDTVRADRLGTYGYSERRTSAFLDELMARGVLFEQASSVRSETWPSMGSVLTGLYPSSHGVLRNGYHFAAEVPLLPELLGAAGYQTAAILSSLCGSDSRGWDRHLCTRTRDPEVAPLAAQWLSERDRDRPYLLWLHYFAAHPPYKASRALRRRLDPAYAGPLRPRIAQMERLMSAGTLNEADLRHVDALYDASLISTDDRLRAAFELLAKDGALDRTLVIVLADHGEELGDHHGYLFHACSVYEAGLHVPLAFLGEGILPAGARVGQTVELLDVTPTILDLLGLPLPAEMHGKSLVPYLERPQASGAGRPAFSQYGQSRIATVRHGRWKLIVNPDQEQPVCFTGAPSSLFPIQQLELYDLAADPGERENLAPHSPEKVAELLATLDARFGGLHRRDSDQEIPDELRRELQALGYVTD